MPTNELNPTRILRTRLKDPSLSPEGARLIYDAAHHLDDQEPAEKIARWMEGRL